MSAAAASGRTAVSAFAASGACTVWDAVTGALLAELVSSAPAAAGRGGGALVGVVQCVEGMLATARETAGGGLLEVYAASVV